MRGVLRSILVSSHGRRGASFWGHGRYLQSRGPKHPEFGQSSTIMSDEIAAQCLLDRKDVVVFDSRFNESL